MNRIIELFLVIVFIFCCLPFILIISIAIRLDSDGPIIFKQKRIGKNGIDFIIYKFRSLYISSHAYSDKPNDNNDFRITRIGKVIRNKGIDELPQLINVLKGNMGLVGPRPEMSYIVDSYSELERKRLSIKPGITGLWQIFAPKNEKIHENLKYDLYYIKKRTLKLDFWIIFKTLKLLFGKYEKSKNITNIRSNYRRDQNAYKIFNTKH